MSRMNFTAFERPVLHKTQNRFQEFLFAVPYIGILFITALLINHSRFSVGFVDDGLYVAMPYRFLKRSRMFADAWELQQT